MLYTWYCLGCINYYVKIRKYCLHLGEKRAKEEFFLRILLLEEMADS